MVRDPQCERKTARRSGIEDRQAACFCWFVVPAPRVAPKLPNYATYRFQPRQTVMAPALIILLLYILAGPHRLGQVGRQL